MWWELSVLSTQTLLANKHSRLCFAAVPQRDTYTFVNTYSKTNSCWSMNFLDSVESKRLQKATWRGQGRLWERLQTSLTTHSGERERELFFLFPGFDVLIFNIISRKPEVWGQPFVNIFSQLNHLSSLLLGQMVWKPCSSRNFIEATSYRANIRSDCRPKGTENEQL